MISRDAHHQSFDMLTINDLKNKMIVLIDGTPYQVLEVKHLHMGRGGSSVQTKIRNLATGQMFSRNFKPADIFEEADIEKRELNYMYSHPVRSKASNGAGRGEFVFMAKEKPSERFVLAAEQVGDAAKWLKPDTMVSAIFLGEKLLSISVPVKMDFKVTEAPPGLKGDRVSAATKIVIIETGAKIQTPLFMNEGDVIRINTETGEYVERITKA